jgi:molybdopterin-guanine dinucleotide biosynthesis protein A
VTSLDVVILAGGQSRRMGRDKAQLRLEGVRLVDHMVARMATVAPRVMVASGARSLGVADEVADAPDCTGPLAGIIAALRASSGAHLAVVPVDAPDTAPALVVDLADRCERGGHAAVVVTVDGHVQALHAVVARWAAPAIEARVRAGEQSPRRLLAWLDAARVDVDAWGRIDAAGRMAADWDRPEDLPPGVS